MTYLMHLYNMTSDIDSRSAQAWAEELDRIASQGPFQCKLFYDSKNKEGELFYYFIN